MSAICITAEYQRLGIRYRAHAILRMSFWVKLFFIIVEFILAVGAFLPSLDPLIPC